MTGAALEKTMPKTRPTNGPLSRFTVLELTVARAGPTCARQLADWGANVIKIETPDDDPEAKGGRDVRHRSDFQNLHRNRRMITLNLKHPEAVEAFKRMADKADVIVENFRPSVKRRLGIDYDTLSARNPRLVYASISGFGQFGPYADRPGVDQIAQGMSGLMSITGEPDGIPMRTGIAIADTMSGFMLSFGILAALHEREVSGKGQWIHTSLLETQVFALDFQNARWLQEGEIPKPVGNNHPTGRPTGLFKASDGWINIATTPSMWGRFCKAIGLERIEKQPEFATGAARVANTDKLNAIIEETTLAQPTQYWIERLNAAGIPCGPVYTMDQVFADPHVKHLGLAQPVPSRVLGEINQVRHPLNFSRTPSVLWTGAPERGENNEDVLRDFGFSAAEIETLSKNGAM